MKLRALVSLVILGIFLSFNSASAIEWVIPKGTDSYGLGIVENYPDSGYSVSRILASNPKPTNKLGQGDHFLCSSVSDPICSGAKDMYANIVFPPCMSAAQKVCVEGLELSSGLGSFQKAIFDREVNSPRTPADAPTGLPAGGGYSIWRSPNVTTSNGESTFATMVRANYFLNSQTRKFEIQTFNAFVAPVSIIKGAFCPWEYYSIAKDEIFGEPNVGVRFAGENCDGSKWTKSLWSEQGSYGEAVDFAAGTTVALTLRMNNDLTGWLNGRMKDVQVDVTPIDSANNILRVQAKPISPPSAMGWLKKSDIKKIPGLYEYFDSRRWIGSGTFENWVSQNSAYGSWDGVGNLDFFNLVESIIEPVPELGRWGFSSDKNSQYVISQEGNSDGYKCFADKTKLLGLVTTNAMIYESGPPKFKDGLLVYKLAGLHTLPDGSVFKGTYDFAIRSETARCIYGFSKAPVMASVSILSSDGSVTNVASEAVQERNGWMTLTARNFTFSSPTVKIKLSQAPTASKVVPLQNKKTITCVKANLIKKVSAVNPKCPAGYKKK